MRHTVHYAAIDLDTFTAAPMLPAAPGFRPTLTLEPAQNTLWRIESISMYGGSVSGLRWSRRLIRQIAYPKMNAVCTTAVYKAP